MLKNDVRKAAEEYTIVITLVVSQVTHLTLGPKHCHITLNTGIFWVFLKNHKKIQILFNLLNNSI